jgi:carboxylesterase
MVGRARRRVLWTGGAVAGVALAAIAWLEFASFDGADLQSHSDPAVSYSDALRRVEALRAADDTAVNPLCRLRLMDHGHRTGRVVVLFHGLTNCPQQFDAFGQRLYERGANVLIARLPHHGLADRMTADLGRLRAAELVGFGDRVVDIARGLGDSVTVSGLSVGGTLAAWVAQQRRDVDRVVVIAPVFGVHQVPVLLTGLAARLAMMLPDRLIWWNDQQRAKLSGPPYCYPRFSTRALGETLRLGFAVAEQARRAPPAAASVVVVTVENDEGVRNESAAAVEALWQRRAPAAVGAFQYAESLGVRHDMIDPLQPYAKVDVSYPPLLERMWR